MNRFFRSRMLKSMIPYFIFGIGLMIAWRLTADFRFPTESIGRFWMIISPFLTGAVIAYILNLPCSALQRLIQKLESVKVKNQYVMVTMGFIARKSRAFGILLLVIIIVVIFSIILNILIPAIGSSIEMFGEEINNYEETIRGWIDRIEELDLPEALTDHINEEAIISATLGWVDGFDFGEILARIVSGFGSIASAVFQAFLAIISSIYLLVEKDKLKAFAIKVIAAVFSKTANDIILKYSRNLDFNFRQYIFAQTIDGIILGSIMTVVLLLFGSPFALVLGLILGIINYIPYFGSIFGTALAVLVIAFTQGLPTAAFAAVVMFAIQQFDGNFIQPKLMGKTFSLSPLLVIISVTVGMHYGGVFGMLVAIPIVAILKDILDMLIAYREESKNKPQSEQTNDFMDRDIW